MSEHESAYFCAKCYAELPLVCSDEEDCPKCGASICCEADYLTEVQWGAAMAEGWRLEREAIECGLIVPKGPGECAP